MQMLYVLRISSQCDSTPCRVGSALSRYLMIDNWHQLTAMEGMPTGDTTEEFSDHTQESDATTVLLDDQYDSDDTVVHYLDNTEGDERGVYFCWALRNFAGR